MSISVDQAVEIFSAAADENLRSSLRAGQVVTLPEEGAVILTGDLHDHRKNFEKILRYSDLGSHPERHVVLHELIHGDYFDQTGAEASWQTLYRAAEFKLDFPEQVHFLLANHDLAQIHGEGIMKAGLSVCEAFTKGVKRDFPQGYNSVNVGITEFLLSFPLAVRTRAGLWMSHSLPTDEQIDGFDFTVFDRTLVGPDYKRRTGPVYQLIWGRGVTPTGVGKFLEKVGAKFAVTGHQPQETGYAANGEQHLIIASDHNQGVYVPWDLSMVPTMDEVLPRVKKFMVAE